MKTLLLWLALVSAIALCPCLGQDKDRAMSPDALRPTEANVAYADVSPTETLDIFLPHGKGPFPLVVNIHGGAFRFGSKEMLDPPMARALLQAGIAVASINYRLSGEAQFPAAVQDAKAAVRFLRAHATKYKLKPDRILAFGQSAGGNLASMLGTSAGITDFDDPRLGNPHISSRVQGVVDWFGPTDFAQMDAQAKAQGCPASSQMHGQADSPESLYLGAALAHIPALVQRANPITYVRHDNPPFLLQKGRLDNTVPFAQSQLLYDALKAAGVKVQYDVFDTAGHGDATIFLSKANVRRVVGFIQTTLK